MKKLVIFLFGIILFAACDDAGGKPNRQRTRKDYKGWVIDKKEPGVFTLAGHYYVQLFNPETFEIERREIGKTAYDNWNIGDTIK